MADVQRFDLLDPAEVARFGGIEIVAEGVVEGFLSGIHRSPFRGFSVEFTEHRAYQPGDELRYLDWKILARADRLFVKQFEQETNLRAMILVDASRSMAWPCSPGGGSSYSSPTCCSTVSWRSRHCATCVIVVIR